MTYLILSQILFRLCHRLRADLSQWSSYPRVTHLPLAVPIQCRHVATAFWGTHFVVGLEGDLSLRIHWDDQSWIPECGVIWSKGPQSYLSTKISMSIQDLLSNGLSNYLWWIIIHVMHPAVPCWTDLLWSREPATSVGELNKTALILVLMV